MPVIIISFGTCSTFGTALFTVVNCASGNGALLLGEAQGYRCLILDRFWPNFDIICFVKKLLLYMKSRCIKSNYNQNNTRVSGCKGSL